MKYQIGDEILVLQTNEEGRINEILDDKMVIVEVRGVRFPIHTDQIDFPYFKRFTEKKIVPEKKVSKVFIDQIAVEKKSQTNHIKANDGMWLIFIPKFSGDEFGDEIVDYFKIYLVNKTSDIFRFYYNQLANGKTAFELKSEVLAHKEIYLHDVDFSILNESPLFQVEFTLATEDKNRAEFLETELKLKPKQVFKKVEELKENNEPTLNYPLFETYPIRVQKDNSLDISSLSKAGFKVYHNTPVKIKPDPIRSVIDLHIEKIMDNFQSLSNFEIIQIQLKEFEKWYQVAITNRQPNLIVIHGIGKGVLKEELHNLLKNRPEVKSFVNQYDPRFGYGATEIFFQY